MIRSRRTGGFTLLELLVTVTVLGVVLLVAVPAIPAPHDGDDAEIVRRALQRGASTAARLDQPVRAAIDPETGALHLRLGDSVLAPEGLGGVSAQLRVSADVSFLPDGRALGGPVLLLAPEGATIIHVDRWTSRVTVERSR